MTMRLALQDLSVTDLRSGARLVAPVSLALAAGEILCLLGESGSGKSLLAHAVMGSLPAGLQAQGRIMLDGQTTRADDPRARRATWGRQVALLPQEPWASLDPTMPALAQVAEVHRHVLGQPAATARAIARDSLAALGLAGAAGQFPFMLSGGMAQRLAFATSTASGAPVLLADEPTKGLDPDRRDQVIALLRSVLARGGVVLAITHDLALPRALGGQVGVMQTSHLVEHGAASEVLQRPTHACTRALLAAEPARWPAPKVSGQSSRAAEEQALLEAEALGQRLGTRWLYQGVSLRLGPGQRLAALGPSGSGKTTLGQVLLGLLPPSTGAVRRRAGLAPLALQKLYQDPLAAFAPGRRLGAAIEDLRRRHQLDAGGLPRWMERLRLDTALLDRLPHQVSGGELQRVALLRLLLLSPAVVFADEPTSRLDPMNQQETMALLVETLAEQGGALLLVTHEVELARRVCTDIIELPGSKAEATG